MLGWSVWLRSASGRLSAIEPSQGRVGTRPIATSIVPIGNVRLTSNAAGSFAQIAVMSGRRPVVKGGFEAAVNVSGAVMSTAC
jgi:hypothetical protein